MADSFKAPSLLSENGMRAGVYPRHKLLKECDTPDGLKVVNDGFIQLRSETFKKLSPPYFMGKNSHQTADHWVFKRDQYRVPSLCLSKYRDVCMLPYGFVYLSDKNAVSADSFEELTTQFDRVWYRPDLSFGVDGKRYCVPRIHNNPHWVEGNQLDLQYALGMPVIEIEEPTFFIGAWYHTNVCHWLLDAFVRLWFLPAIKEESIKIAIYSPLPAFAMESLALMGISKNDINFLHYQKVYRFQNLYMPSRLVSQYNYFSKESVDFFGALAERIPDLNRAKPKLLYISRRDTKKRQCLNEKQFEDRLIARGFTILQLTDLTVKERLEYMQSAEIVISPCGAGLAHAIMMRPDTKIVVTGSSDMHFHSNMFVNLAAQNNQQVFLISGKNLENKSRTHDSWELDIEDAIAQIDKILGD